MRCMWMHLAVFLVTSKQLAIGVIHSKGVAHIFDSVENSKRLAFTVRRILHRAARSRVNRARECLAQLYSFERVGNLSGHTDENLAFLFRKTAMLFRADGIEDPDRAPINE